MRPLEELNHHLGGVAQHTGPTKGEKGGGGRGGGGMRRQATGDILFSLEVQLDSSNP